MSCNKIQSHIFNREGHFGSSKYLNWVGFKNFDICTRDSCKYNNQIQNISIQTTFLKSSK